MKRSPKKKERVSLLPFLYKALPLCLVSLALLNLWFIYSFVNRERVTLDGVRDQVLSSVSNTYNFVHSSMSNYVEEVRFRTSLRYRPVFTSSPAASSSFPLNVSTNGHGSVASPLPSPPVFHGNLSASYYRVSGVPFLELPDGFRYGVGDDFGYGVIESISSLCVVCGGVRYRLQPLAHPSVAPPISVARSSSLPSTPEMEIKPL